MSEWTRDMVEERIVEAAAVLRQLPGPRAQGYFSTWPDILLSAQEIARQEPRPMKVPPHAAAICRMEEAITWNRFLEREDANLCGRGRRDAVEGDLPPLRHQPADRDRRWEYALSVIAWRLNGRQVNRKRGMSFMIARARG